MDPLVSFVVPCYKLAHLLPECVNSILGQTYPSFELLIMDNCSPDNTPEIAQSFHDPRVRYIRNETNIGHLRNFNKGIMLSRGRYVWLISADDALRSPHALERFVHLMERNPDVGYAFCRAVELHGKKELGGKRSDYGNEDRIWDGLAFLDRLIWSNRIAQSSVIARKECYESVGLFPLDMPYAGDWYLWCILALHYRVAYLPGPMVSCRIHEESLTTLFNRENASICLSDELNVLWRVRCQAELAGVLSLRSAFNACIGRRAARSSKSTSGERPGLSAADFETMLRQHVTNPKDEQDIRAHFYISLGDEQFWAGEYSNATRSYRLGLRLRPWRLKSWAKYILLTTGSFGIWLRRLVFQLRDQLQKQRGACTGTELAKVNRILLI